MDASTPGTPPTSVLFVCLGNICRSPLAEGVFRHLAEEAGLSDRFSVDSAGTGAWHVGEPADGRAALVATRNGVQLRSRARQVVPDDLETFDVVVAMDRDNLRHLERMAAGVPDAATLHLLRDYDPEDPGGDVPDPYYGGPSGFENVYQIVRRSCERLLDHLTPPEGAA